MQCARAGGANATLTCMHAVLCAVTCQQVPALPLINQALPLSARHQPHQAPFLPSLHIHNCPQLVASRTFRSSHHDGLKRCMAQHTYALRSAAELRHECVTVLRTISSHHNVHSLAAVMQQAGLSTYHITPPPPATCTIHLHNSATTNTPPPSPSLQQHSSDSAHLCSTSCLCSGLWWGWGCVSEVPAERPWGLAHQCLASVCGDPLVTHDCPCWLSLAAVLRAKLRLVSCSAEAEDTHTNTGD
jgi:hypothetical protein